MMMKIKSVTAVFLCSVLFLSAFAFPADTHAASDSTQTVSVNLKNSLVSTWVSTKTPKEYVDQDYRILKVGSGAITLLHYDLPAGVLASDIVSAKLCMKTYKGDKNILEAAAVLKPWSMGFTRYSGIKTGLKFTAKAAKAKPDKSGLYTLNVKGIVQDWLSGKIQNNGFAVKGTKKGKTTIFYGSDLIKKKQVPTLKITYKKTAPRTDLGRFGFTDIKDEFTNCMAYALRDIDPTFWDVFHLNMTEMYAIYRDKGMNAALNYYTDYMCSYIDEHKEGLGITSYRKLDSATAPIDPAKEYVIATKIGFNIKRSEIPKKINLKDIDEHCFDFHFQVRLNDGRWAQKFPGFKYSRIVPGSNASFPTGKFPWDSSYNWGYTKSMDYYKSKAVYYAIEKNTDGFTRHLTTKE